MFKHFILVTAAIGMMAGASAQSWLTTGNSLSGTEKFGSTNNKSLDIITNNTVRMKINNKGNVGIGLTTLGTYDRLSVKNTVPAAVVGPTTTRGVYSVVTGNATATYNNVGVAVTGICNDNNNNGYGGSFGGDYMGVYGTGFGFQSESYGLYGYSNNYEGWAHGVYGMALSDDNAYNYGVYGWAEQGYLYSVAVMAYDNFGGPSTAGYFDGDIEYTGAIYDVSDAKFKSNVTPIEGALGIVNRLAPKSYELNQAQYPGLNFGRDQEYGFIAQEVKEVLPELVKECIAPINPYDPNTPPSITDPFEYLAVNYTGLIPVLTKAIQEQQELIDAQAAAIAAQQKSLEDLTARIQLLEAARNQTQSAVLTGTGARLEQNTPNPFTGITAVAYYIPESTRSAQLIISDLSGREIETLEIDAMGNGTVQIDATQLAAGNYIYTLVADMAVVGTRMFSVSR